MYQYEDVISVKILSCLIVCEKIAKMSVHFSSVLGVCLILQVLNPYMMMFRAAGEASYTAILPFIDALLSHDLL